MAEQAVSADLSAALERYLEPWRERAFDWRAANCVHFVAGWVARWQALEARVLAPLRWQLALRAEHGGLVPAVSAVLGCGPSRIADHLRTGDIAAVAVFRERAWGPAAGSYAPAMLPGARPRHALGIVQGAQVMLRAAPSGIVGVPLSFATVGWRAGT